MEDENTRYVKGSRRVVPAEVEWGYALMQGDRVVDEVFDSMDDLADYYGIRFHEGEYPVRRVKAGPWVPVKGTEQEGASDD